MSSRSATRRASPASTALQQPFLWSARPSSRAVDAGAHEQADDVVALLAQQVRRHGAVHAAAHRQDHPRRHAALLGRRCPTHPSAYTDTRRAATVLVKREAARRMTSGGPFVVFASDREYPFDAVRAFWGAWGCRRAAWDCRRAAWDCRPAPGCRRAARDCRPAACRCGADATLVTFGGAESGYRCQSRNRNTAPATWASSDRINRPV